MLRNTHDAVQSRVATKTSSCIPRLMFLTARDEEPSLQTQHPHRQSPEVVNGQGQHGTCGLCAPQKCMGILPAEFKWELHVCMSILRVLPSNKLRKAFPQSTRASPSSFVS